MGYHWPVSNIWPQAWQLCSQLGSEMEKISEQAPFFPRLTSGLEGASEAITFLPHPLPLPSVYRRVNPVPKAPETVIENEEQTWVFVPACSFPSGCTKWDTVSLTALWAAQFVSVWLYPKGTFTPEKDLPLEGREATGPDLPGSLSTYSLPFHMKWWPLCRTCTGLAGPLTYFLSPLMALEPSFTT
jgi:hypothetical protein